jgi:NADH dehydrogenase
MILVTGGTGFIGQKLVSTLVSLGYPVRLLMNPSTTSPQLPRGVPVDIAISAIQDERNLRAAMKDIQIVFHLISTEWHGINAEFSQVDVPAAASLSRVAKEMQVKRFFFLSHIGADRSSAYRSMQAKALAEAEIIASGVPYTIIRSGVVFGEGDHFTETIAGFMRSFPLVFPIPAGGDTQIQPIWVDDLITVILLCLDDENTINRIFPVGGMEVLSFREVCALVAEKIGNKKKFFDLSPVAYRSLVIALEQWFPKLPRMYFWTDYLAENRITTLDSVSRTFFLIPTRIGQYIQYSK